MKLQSRSTLYLTLLLLSLLTACAPKFITPAESRVTPLMTVGQFVSFDGARLPVQRWLPQGPAQAVIIALHGFNDYAHFIAPAASWWSARGIAVYAYDQRGFGAAPDHGRWPGRQMFTLDLQAFVSVIRQQYGSLPVYLLGESMGAAVVLEALAETKLQVDGVILSAPAVRGWRAMPLWQQWGLRLAAHTIPWQRFTGESLGVVASDNRAMLIALGRDPLVIKKTRVDTIYGLVNLMQAGFDDAQQLSVPALVLYGEKDQVIPAAAVRAAFGPAIRQPQQRLQLYRNGYHMLLRDLQAEVVWRDILSWVRDSAAPLPSQELQLSRPFLSPAP
ncbi:MAG: alpha/beta hydrolase [Zetaproteobacteria bacterium CG12_big_fil_rev_8_21_14_0_65_54_13]|nr:MAG: lysophospholipase [Zetaproteobacteria bacterium CG23_combo_of_CG06-09_8_20_14_all_54_7]PIW47675.1 MAG: alpha/beta hydrolase [Zetaproteobacteria bacterium CG12_big_fil_rev_8_21_14_0_65_54_13]PIX54494.1 MAG: alpha/beta hydrolase [Zetaproteobacteria bacterium CG_4_10_14_3_um_filter_54_28]PJA28666.1 MAG: alpha/beta hydrolase [Zetaproteobacteria bacterium CG_4_9_14_3_um_filter_54_145]